MNRSLNNIIKKVSRYGKITNNFYFSDNLKKNIEFNISHSTLSKLEEVDMNKDFFVNLLSNLETNHNEDYKKVISWINEIFSTDFNHSELEKELNEVRNINNKNHELGSKTMKKIESCRKDTQVMQNKLKAEIETERKNCIKVFINKSIFILSELKKTHNDIETEAKKQNVEDNVYSNFKEGFNLLHSNAKTIFKRNKVEEIIPKIGNNFDENSETLEESIDIKTIKSLKESKIKLVLETGYKYDDVVCKKAIVKLE